MKPQDLQTIARAALMPTTAPATPAPTAADAIAAKVDELGQLHAAIADMKKRYEEIRAELEDAGLKEMEGQQYRASFAQVAGRTLTDWETIAAKFKPSAQLIRAHTKTGKPSTRLNVTACKITH
jgi:hypothetical protein